MGASLAAQLATQILAAGGSYAVNGILQVAFQHNVAVNATYYKTNYTTISGGGTGSVFDRSDYMGGQNVTFVKMLSFNAY